ncbi:MAG TPA: DedA family protein [Polyangia bacterium]|nr:DedA family protein [Polyangia bacterium]
MNILSRFIDHLSTMTPLGAYAWLGGILLLCGLGLPIPEDISLIAAGYFSWKGVLYIHTAFAICFAAVVTGDTAAFFMGRLFGRRVLRSQLARRYFTPRRQLRVRAYFRKFGSRVVLVGRFTPGLRFTIFFTAGTLHTRPSTFFVYDFAAAAFSVPILVYSAWFFGAQIDWLVSVVRRTENGIFIAVVLVAGLLALRAWRRHKKRVAARAAAVADGGPSPPAAPPSGAGASSRDDGRV